MSQQRRPGSNQKSQGCGVREAQREGSVRSEEEVRPQKGACPPPPQLEQNGELLPRAGGGSHTRVGLRKVWAV